MKILSSNDFFRRQEELKDRPLKDKKELFRHLGIYFQQVLGNEIEEVFLFETERFLNESYLSANSEESSPELQKMLMQAVGMASYLSYAITHGKIDPSFFARVRALGETLIRLSASI